MYNSVIVDALNLSYRSWWNVRELRSSNGDHTGLEFGFIKNLLAWKRIYTKSTIALAWDGAPVRGKTLYAEYKAGRDKSSQDGEAPWRPRLETLKEVFAPVTPSYYNPELEADEIIAAYVKQQERLGNRTLILSTDADMQQLVSDLTQVSPFKEEIVTGRPGVEQEWGVPPEKLPLLRAMSGDKSDNLPGVPRISTEFKVKLANESNSIDDLIERIKVANYLSSAQRTKLIEGTNIIRRNHSIMTLQDLTEPPQLVQEPTGDNTKVIELCRRLELRSLLERREWELFKQAT